MARVGTQAAYRTVHFCTTLTTISNLSLNHTGAVQHLVHDNTALLGKNGIKPFRKIKQVGAVVAHVSSLRATYSYIYMYELIF